MTTIKIKNGQFSRRVKLRFLLMFRLCEGMPSCCECGENNILFLTIDHIEGGGGEHRRKYKGRSEQMYTDMLNDTDFAKKYQVMCMNCNHAKGMVGASVSLPEVIGTLPPIPTFEELEENLRGYLSSVRRKSPAKTLILLEETKPVEIAGEKMPYMSLLGRAREIKRTKDEGWETIWSNINTKPGSPHVDHSRDKI